MCITTKNRIHSSICICVQNICTSQLWLWLDDKFLPTFYICFRNFFYKNILNYLVSLPWEEKIYSYHMCPKCFNPIIFIEYIQNVILEGILTPEHQWKSKRLFVVLGKLLQMQ
jgi:hypothetical protein